MRKIKLLLIMTFLFLFVISANGYAIKTLEGTFVSGGESYTGFYMGDYDSSNYVPSYFGYTWDAWTGFYIGTFVGNESSQDLINIASYYLEVDSSFFDDYQYAKVDPGPGTDDFLTVQFTSFNDDGEGIEGEWDVDPYSLGFYAVKAGNYFALYYVLGESQGLWTTAHIEVGNDRQPGISHFSVLAGESEQVPEPGMVILLGIGLIGLAFFSRRRLFNQ